MSHSREHSFAQTTSPGFAGSRTPVFIQPRRRWPGLLAAGVIGAAIAAAAISSWQDSRTLGTQVDASVDAAKSAAKSGIDRSAEGLREVAGSAAVGTAAAASGVVASLQDAGITAAIKTALAADPVLSAWQIDVSTQDGVVKLAGPAPDARSRDRAEVIAKAPQGVHRVENLIVVAPKS